MFVLSLVPASSVDGNNKYACFDFDWTLVKPKDGRMFPKDKDDWTYLRDSVPTTLLEYSQQGYKIVVFTNQTKEWKINMIKDVVANLRNVGVSSIDVYGAMGKFSPYAKPNTKLFDDNILPEWDKENSFYCGDAYDASTCWSDSDRVFANNIGIKFCTPEQIFSFDAVDVCETDYSVPHQEVVIMVGYPSSGKSTLCKNNLKGYEVISGDLLKTQKKMIDVATPFVDGGKSVVFDATHGTIEKRKKIIDFARARNITTRIFVMPFDIDRALELNTKRATLTGTKPISKIAYYTYRKKYEPPTDAECEILCV